MTMATLRGAHTKTVRFQFCASHTNKKKYINSLFPKMYFFVGAKTSYYEIILFLIFFFEKLFQK